MRGHKVFLAIFVWTLCCLLHCTTGRRLELTYKIPTRTEDMTDEQYEKLLAKTMDESIKHKGALYTINVKGKTYYGKVGEGIDAKFEREFPKSGRPQFPSSPPPITHPSSNPISKSSGENTVPKSPPLPKALKPFIGQTVGGVQITAPPPAQPPSPPQPQPKPIPAVPGNQITLNQDLPEFDEKAGIEAATGLAKAIVNGFRQDLERDGKIDINNDYLLKNCKEVTERESQLVRAMKQADGTLLEVLPKFYGAFETEMDVFSSSISLGITANTNRMEKLVKVHAECVKPVLIFLRV